MTDPAFTLRAFLLIARYGSFTRAAAELEVTASALSQSLRQLEQRLGVRLLQRTTRRVGLTEAGRVFSARITPALAAIDGAMEAARQHGDHPAGTLRLTTSQISLLTGVIPDFLTTYPEITLDIRIDNGLTDLIGEGFDAGIRLGERLEKDMVAVPLGGPMRSLVVGSPDYFARYGRPKHPRELQAHNCVRYRFVTSGAIYRWEFAERGRWFEIGVSGNLIANENALALALARAGTALAHLPTTLIDDDLAEGRLESILERWLPSYDGLYLYYPSRFQVPAKLRVFIDFLRARLG